MLGLPESAQVRGDQITARSKAGKAPVQQESEPLRRDRAPLALVLLAGLVTATSVAHVPVVVAALATALLMVVTGCCSVGQAPRSGSDTPCRLRAPQAPSPAP